MESMQLASEYEQERIKEFKARSQIIMQEQNGSRQKISVNKLKQIEQKIKSMEKEVYSRINPHLKDAERCLRLKAYDFSAEDKAIAEKLF